MMLELHATPEEVMRAVETLQQFGREQKLADRELFGLALSLEECGSNIVDHAYRRDSSRKFRVLIERVADKVTIELRDGGAEFDPTRAPVPPPAVNEDERPPGQWGLQLVRYYMDEIEYRREGDENVLRLTKRLAEPTKTPNHPL